MKRGRVKGVVMLLCAAVIWGSTFVAQSVGADSVGAFTFMFVRCLLGTLVLSPIVIMRDSTRKKALSADVYRSENRKTFKAGAYIGVAFFAASVLQQFAFSYSSAGKIAFITALYMFFVPVIGLLFGRKAPFLVWIAALFGVLGLYFLSVGPEGLGAVNKGDFLAFLCAILFAVQILLIEKYAPDMDGLKLTMLEFITASILSFILMLMFERPSFASIKSAALPLLYAGVMSCGIAYTFQMLGQKYVEAPVASILMCTESVFAVLSAAIFLHERMNRREILGCLIMFAAIIAAQLAEIKNNAPYDRKK